jgi:microcystin-dependent protein
MPTTLITDASIVLPIQGFKGDKGDQGIQGIQGPPGATRISADPNNLAKLGSDTFFLVQGVGSGAKATTHVQVVAGDDPQLSDARIPLLHAAAHKTGGVDVIVLDSLGSPSDNTNLNASTTAHGLLRKLDGNAAHTLDGTGAWSTPAGGGNMSKSDYDQNNDLVVDHAHLADAVAWNNITGTPLIFPPSPHGGSHITTADPIPAATATATGLVPVPPNDGDSYLNGLAVFARVLPAGVIMPFGGAAAPAGFLLCDGTSYPVASFPALFSVLGYTYGGSGPNFSTPDLRGRTVVGAGQGTGLTNRVRGGTTGEELHTLSIAELAVHGHALPDHSHSIPGGGNHSHTFTTADHYHLIPAGPSHNHTDSGHAHTSFYPNPYGTIFGAQAGGSTTYIANGVSSNNTSVNAANISTVGNLCPANTNWLSQTMALPVVTTSASGAITPGTAATSLSPAAAGSGAAHNNMQPSLFLNFVIKA